MLEQLAGGAWRPVDRGAAPEPEQPVMDEDEVGALRGRRSNSSALAETPVTTVSTSSGPGTCSPLGRSRRIAPARAGGRGRRSDRPGGPSGTSVTWFGVSTVQFPVDAVTGAKGSSGTGESWWQWVSSAAGGRWTATGSWSAVPRGDEQGFERLVSRYRGPPHRLCAGGGSATASSRRTSPRRSSSRPCGACGPPTGHRLQGVDLRDRPQRVHRPAPLARRHAEMAALSDDLAESGPSNDPPASFELRQRLAELYLAFGQLPPLERELLALRELGGLSYAELAARQRPDHRRRRERPPPRPAKTARPLPAAERRAPAPRRPRHPAAHPATPQPVRLWDTAAVHRGVAQPGSAHRSGR